MEILSANKSTQNLTTFYGGNTGTWKVLSATAFAGISLPTVEKIEIVTGENIFDASKSEWALQGFSSNIRYTTREEKNELDKSPSVLGKPENNCAALIPLKKSPEWWLMTQDERRKIFEEQSQHIHFSLKYLTHISRKLYHSRDLGEDFDFLTWFEFAPEHSGQFDELVAYLRQTEEWKYVSGEIDIRLIRD